MSATARGAAGPGACYLVGSTRMAGDEGNDAGDGPGTAPPVAARSAKRWRTLARGALLLLLAGAVAAVFATDLHNRVDVGDLRDRMRDAGWAGAAGFVVALALLQPVGVSVYLFMISASAVWPAPLAVLLSWLGIMGAGVVSFGFSRFVAYDWVHARLGARLDRWDRRLATTGFRTVLVTRLLFFTTVPVQLMYGISSVRFRDFVAGSALGVLPTTVLGVAIGSRVAAWFAARPFATWTTPDLLVAIAVIVAVAALVAVVVMRRRRAATEPG